MTGNTIGTDDNNASVGEIVIHGSSIRKNGEDYESGYSIGCGEYATFDRIDIQDSRIDIPGATLGAAIGSGRGSRYIGESIIRIANSQVFASTYHFSPAIGVGADSYGERDKDGTLRIFIENSSVIAKGGYLRPYTQYTPGIGKKEGRNFPETYIQVMNSTVESFRHTERGNNLDFDYVYDDLHTRSIPGIPEENITVCGSTVNGTRIDHSFDEYGKCTLCGKYDLGYCYEKGLLTIEGLTDCSYDGSEKKLTGLSLKTGENTDRQLAEGTDYTAGYSNNIYTYTLTTDEAGFDPAKAPKVTLYGTGGYCGKVEHYFTISGDAQASYSVKYDTAGGRKISDKSDIRWQQRVLDGVEPPTRIGYDFRGWNCNGKPVLANTTYAELAGDASMKSITLTAQWADSGYPAGEVRIDENSAWQKFQVARFNLIYNTGKTVTITAMDAGGKPVSIGYLISNEMIVYQRDCESKEFTAYTGPIHIEEDGNYAVYVKLTNAAGKSTYISTGGFVIDTTAPVIDGIEDGGVYYGVSKITCGFSKNNCGMDSWANGNSPKSVVGRNRWIFN